METTPKTPFEVDTKLAALYDQLAKHRGYHRAELDSLHHEAGDAKRRGRWDMTDVKAMQIAIDKAKAATSTPWKLEEIEKTLDQMRKHEDAIGELYKEMEPLEARWAAERWTRFFRAKSHDGHVHSSENCPTLHKGAQRTDMGWLPEMSGRTEAEAVAEYGRTMCTVCFPSAPADPNFALEPRAQRAARKANEAAKAARAAEAAAKAITNPDGTPLRGRWGVIRTLVTAQRELGEALFDAGFYPQIPNGEGGFYGKDAPERLAEAERIIAAIAHKTERTVDEVRTEYQAKADKKIAKELKGVKK